MNIFFLDLDPCVAATYMIDKHVVKMRAECIQMIASVQKFYGIDISKDWPLNSVDMPYKGGYPNHPCTKWTGVCKHNYLWLYDHLVALENEYRLRFNNLNSHTARICHFLYLRNDDFVKRLPNSTGITNPVLAMPPIYHTPFENPDPVLSYRAFYKGEKTRDKNGNSMLSYRARGLPKWMK